MSFSELLQSKFGEHSTEKVIILLLFMYIFYYSFLLIILDRTSNTR